MIRLILATTLIVLGVGKTWSQTAFDPNRLRCQIGINLAIQAMNKVWNGNAPSEAQLMAYGYILGVADTLFLDEPVPKKRVGMAIGGLAAYCQDSDEHSLATATQKLSSSEIYLRENPTIGD